MQLTPWIYTGREGFSVRGWHTPPSGKPLLHFLHGNGFCARAYSPMLELLTSDFDLWLSDAQGHGDSDPGGRFVGWNRSAKLAMEALLSHENLFNQVPRHAVGHSFGGVLTALMVSEHSDFFERAVLLDPVLMPSPMLWAIQMSQWTGLAGHSELPRKARARRRHWSSRAEAMASLKDRGVYKNWAEPALQAFIDHALRDAPDGGVELKCAPELEAEIFSSVAQGLWAALNAIQIPVQVIHANNTFPFIGTAVRQWKALNPQLSDQPTPGGHCFMQENPNETAKLLKRYLKAPFQGMA